MLRNSNAVGFESRAFEATESSWSEQSSEAKYAFCCACCSIWWCSFQTSLVFSHSLFPFVSFRFVLFCFALFCEQSGTQSRNYFFLAPQLFTLSSVFLILHSYIVIKLEKQTREKERDTERNTRISVLT